MLGGMPIDVRMLEQMQRRATGIPQGARCRKCGYEITGLHPDGRCPECGSALNFDDRLVNAAPDYVKLLHVGAMLVELSLVITILLFIAGIFVAFSQSPALVDALDYAALPIGVLALVGWWMLSARDPGLGERDEGQRSRLALRVLLAVGFVGGLISAGLTYTTIQPTLIDLLDLLLTAVQFAGFVVSMLYVRVLAGRIPDYGLIQKATNVLKLGVIGIIAIVAVMVLGIVAALAGAPLGLSVLGCAGIIIGIGAIVWAVMYILLIDAIRSALAKVRSTMPT